MDTTKALCAAALVLTACSGTPFSLAEPLGSPPVETSAVTSTSDAGVSPDADPPPPEARDADAGATAADPPEASAPLLETLTTDALVYPDTYIAPTLPACPVPNFEAYWTVGSDAGPYPYTLQISTRVFIDWSAPCSTVTAGQFIYYTTDGTVPGFASPVFNCASPIDVSKTMTVRAFTDGPGDCSASRIVSASLTVPSDGGSPSLTESGY